MIGSELIKKYNVKGPRYTSYPTALYFTEQFNKQALLDDISDYHNEPRKISLYIHIPFCQSLCWYCGCTKIITRDKSSSKTYLTYLEKELKIRAAQLHPDHEVVQIHLGGGTPSFLPADDLEELSQIISGNTNLSEEAEIGIEIDPREVSRLQIETMANVGFNRASVGIQDMNEEVQKAIHRIQPYEQTQQVIRWLREAGITSINGDLIYGLPKQTPELFANTLEKTLEFSLDRYAIYSYAHVPWMKPSQKLISEDDLPESDQKLQMLQYAIEFLNRQDYEYIGMDHFSKKDDDLAKALRNGTLQRNFQGYSTHAGVEIIGIGMSSISSIGPWYLQNSKHIDDYYSALDNGELPIVKALALSRDDLIRREMIMRIMCSAGLNIQAISRKWDIDARSYFSEEWTALNEFEEDGLLSRSPEGIKITEKGKLFVRNIAMTFDRYLIDRPVYNQAYSQTV